MPQQPSLIEDVEALRSQVASWRRDGATIGFVPTMGALHEGHMALVDAARERCDKVFASIFVNPKQFGPNEDLARYPRTLEADREILGKHGCDAVFVPSVEEMYPEGFASEVRVTGHMTEVLCGASRAGHFDGVATVVTLLMNMAQADHLFFGEKDWQQLAIIRRFSKDLKLTGEIHGVSTVRAEDGLALSSRNQYLNETERKNATAIYETMLWLRANIDDKPLLELCEQAKDKILKTDFNSIDYLEIRHEDTLESMQQAGSGARCFIAAHIGTTRLIDNMRVYDD